MNIVSQERNYIPIDLDTRFHACSRKVESHWKVSKVCSFYHVKRSSLFRWLKTYDGTRDSLKDHSHRPKTKHPNSLSEEAVTKVINLRRRNPGCSYMEIWIKMHRDNGRYALIETKLGNSQVNEGAKHLCEIESLVRKFNEEHPKNKMALPTLKIVLTGTRYALKRDDGVFVIPIGCLKIS